MAVAKADVTLMRRVRVGEKTYRWVAVGSVQTDKTGHYGFCNLPEGSYFVNSQGTMRAVGEKVNTEPLPRDYVQTFYPNVLEEKASQPIRITSGAAKKLDLVLRDAPTHHVRGHVVFPSGKTLLRPFVVLSHVNPGNSTYIGYHAEINTSGHFDFAGIPPGKYRLVAIADSGEQEIRKAPVAAAIKKEWRAATELEVKDNDVAAPEIALAANGTVSGQLWNTRGENFKGGWLFITLVTGDGHNVTHPLEDGRELPLDTTDITADGHFVLHQLPPGKYRIAAAGRVWMKRPPSDKAADYLAGATIAGRDALRDGFDVKPGQEINDAAIVLAEGTGSIRAKVRDETGKPRSNAVLLLVPSDEMKLQWHRYTSGCSYPDGDVYLTGIPPGDYRIFAMDTPPVAHYIQPWICGTPEHPRLEDLKIYEKNSTSVHILSGTTSELNLPLIHAQ